MEFLGNNETQFSAEDYLRICINSVSGCKVRVGNDFYNIYINSGGRLVKEKVSVDFEMTEEELNSIELESL